MEYFVLAMISRGGLHSLYELQKGVGLQPGGIQPVLKRLEQEGFLERSKQEKRRRRLMTVTKLGEHFLNVAWHDCLADYPDVESILRAATVGILMGDRERAYRYLLHIAKQHDKNVPIELADEKQQTWSSVDWYVFMRRSWEIRRRQSAADAFREIAKELEETKRS